MALVKCKECGHDVSSQARVCPQCGKRLKENGCGTAILMVITFFVVLFAGGILYVHFSPSKSSVPSMPQVPAPKTRIPFSITGGKSLDEAGSIIIDPKHVNEADMKALGETLDYETRDRSHVFIGVFKDKKSAQFLTQSKMLYYSDRLDDHSGDKHYRNLIGKYEKNTSTGHHVIIFKPDGWLSEKAGKFINLRDTK